VIVYFDVPITLHLHDIYAQKPKKLVK